MNFLYPGFLFALFAIAVPIIIHLFNFRTYKTVYFSRVDLLKNINQETKSKSNLKHLLILFFRILSIAAIVIAFAQPYLTSKQSLHSVNKKKVVIYIDNSFSAEAEGKYGKIIETAKKKALEIIEAHKEQNEFLFITNDFDPKHQHFVSNEQMKDFIVETEISASVQTMSNVILKINDLCAENKTNNSDNIIYIISDFQRTSTKLEKITFKKENQYVLFPLEPVQSNNIFIDSVWFESPQRSVFQNDELFVKIVNKSDESYTDMPLKLYLNNMLKSTGSFNLAPNASVTQMISYSNEKTGFINGWIELSDFPISFDNTFYFSYYIEPKNAVLIIDPKEKNKFIDRIFEDLNYVHLTYDGNLQNNIKNIESYECIILNNYHQISENDIQLLSGYTTNGGKLIVFTPFNADFTSYNKLFNRLKVNLITGNDTSKIYASQINYNSRIFKDVFKKKDKNLDFPYILKRIKFSDQIYADEEVILSSENNDKIISSAKVGDGMVYVFSQSADDKCGNLVYHPLWVPAIYNMVIYNTIDQQLFYTAGHDNNLDIKLPQNVEDVVFKIINEENAFDFIPKYSKVDGKTASIFWSTEIQKAGQYKIMSGNNFLKGFSINYDRKESDLSAYKSEEIETFLAIKNIKNASIIDSDVKDVKEKLISNSVENKLWKFFLILALIFILAEILLIRLTAYKKKS